VRATLKVVTNRRMLQTQYSMQANDLAESFRSTVGKLRVGPNAYAPDMTAPEGPSTGGGVQAMQHLRLVPPQPTMPTLVVGHLNQRNGAAEIRTFEHVDAICRERFKQGAPFDSTHYAQVLESMQGFLAACGLKVVLAGPPGDLFKHPDEGSTSPGSDTKTAFAAAVGAVVLLGSLAAALVWFFKK
jgi:hypothetical protein